MANIQFWRSNQMSDTSFLDLVKRTFGKTFTKGIDAKNWLKANGYYTSYPDIVTDGLVLNLDAANSSSFKGEPTTNIVNSNGQNYNPLDLYTWAYNGNTSVFSRDYKAKKSPANGIPLKHVSSGTDSYSQTYASAPYNLCAVNIGQTWTISVYAKSTIGTNLQLWFFESNAAGAYSIATYEAFSATGEWQRLTFTRTITTGSYIQSRVATSTNGATVYWDGLQVEQKSYATHFVNGTRGTTYATGGGWCDLSGNGNHGEISVSNTYNSEKNGVVKTNGSYVTISNNSSLQFTTGFTQIIGFKLNTSFSDGYKTLLGKPNYVMYGIIVEWYGNNPVLFDFTSDSDGSRNNILLSPDHSDYVIVAHTYDKSLSSNNHVAYVLDKNGIQTGQATVQQNVRITTDLTYIGGLDVNISFILEYNRGLTSSEITQNYNAYKERFGL
jgi:hypothetical protein